jgi:hypothetical protein
LTVPAPKESGREVTMADYEVVKYLGSGAFGKVLEVRWSNAEAASMRIMLNERNTGFG